MSAHMAKRQSIFGYLDATFRQRDVCLVDKTVSDPKPISDSPSSLAEMKFGYKAPTKHILLRLLSHFSHIPSEGKGGIFVQ